MKKELKRKIIIISALVVLAILAAFGYGVTMEQPVNAAAKGINVLPESGFFQEDIQIIVEKPMEDATSQVYYTVDGSMPSRENGILYEKEIFLEALQEEMVNTFRFKAFYEDGTESDVITRTYFCGENVPYRYSTMVLHLSGDPEGLFGYDDGIFVPGRLFDEFMEANPDAFYGNGVDANYQQKGPEFEREVYVQLFDQFGNVLMENAGGVRIVGNATRMKNQKSFKLYARSEYSANNEFEYPLFADLIAENTNVVAHQYKRLMVRNAGTDNGFAYLRSELVGELAADAGFPDVMHAEPVCVYINGQYQGIYWIENCFDRQYFENRYGEYTGEFVLLTGDDVEKEVDEDSTEVPTQEELDYINEYNEWYNKYSQLDLTLEENYKAVRDFIDVENYLEYFAIQSYVANYDWPTKNEKVYRYVSDTGEYTEDSVFDGKYRFLLFDADYGFGLKTIFGQVGISWDESTLDIILSDVSPLFGALMKREDCRQYFVNYTCDLINDALSSQHVAAVVDEMHASRYGELYHMLENTDIQKNSIWTWEDPNNLCIDFVDAQIEEIKDFANNRPGAVYQDIQNHFGYEQIYQLQVSHSTQNGGVKINGITTEQTEFSGIYYGEIPISLKPCVPANMEFDYWLVNGEERYEEELILTGADAVDGYMDVMLFTKWTEEPCLQLYQICSEGNNDYIELINYSEEPLSTFSYFLSDNDKFTQYALPKLIIQPGEILRIYGKNCMDLDSLGEFCMNFNLTEGELVTLSKGKDTVESVVIPNMSETSVYVKDFFSGEFLEKTK